MSQKTNKPKNKRCGGNRSTLSTAEYGKYILTKLIFQTDYQIRFFIHLLFQPFKFNFIDVYNLPVTEELISQFLFISKHFPSVSYDLQIELICGVDVIYRQLQKRLQVRPFICLQHFCLLPSFVICFQFRQLSVSPFIVFLWSSMNKKPEMVDTERRPYVFTIPWCHQAPILIDQV